MFHDNGYWLDFNYSTKSVWNKKASGKSGRCSDQDSVLDEERLEVGRVEVVAEVVGDSNEAGKNRLNIR